MNEVNVQPVDLGHEVREGVELRFARAPVVVRPPVAGECLHRRQRHALRVVGDRLAIRPARRGDPATHVLHRLLRDVDPEGPDRVVMGRRTGRRNVSHGSLLTCPCSRSSALPAQGRPLPRIEPSSLTRGDFAPGCLPGRRLGRTHTVVPGGGATHDCGLGGMTRAWVASAWCARVCRRRTRTGSHNPRHDRQQVAELHAADHRWLRWVSGRRGTSGLSRRVDADAAPGRADVPTGVLTASLRQALRGNGQCQRRAPRRPERAAPRATRRKPGRSVRAVPVAVADESARELRRQSISPGRPLRRPLRSKPLAAAPLSPHAAGSRALICAGTAGQPASAERAVLARLHAYLLVTANSCQSPGTPLS